jgi:hypothetical protein
MIERFFAAACAFAVVSVVLSSAHAQFSGNPAARPLIAGTVNESNLVRLPGNVRPEVTPANDRGSVPADFPLEHMFIQLRRAPTQEAALTQFIERLHEPGSSDCHRWLTPSEFGTQYGPAASDIAQVTAWLQGRGFRVNLTYPSGMAIDFSGTAAQVAAAFRTEIHYIAARGTTHFANVSDPQIPAALAPALVGVVALNDFTPRPLSKKRNYSFTNPDGPWYAVTPQDLAIIYNFNPVFAAGNTGLGQTIYLIEDTDLYSTADWTTFRSTFGLSGYTAATLNTVHPPPPFGPNNCSDPGVNPNGDDGEAILDAEYSSAAAPSAAITIASCANGQGVDGLLVAIVNLVNTARPPAIISISYGACEAGIGAASNAAYNSIYQQGVAEGVSIFVSAGDELAGGCNPDEQYVSSGIAVNGLASTPYNVAVGGTDFSDVYSNTIPKYWSTNSSTFGSAKSYIPEIPWNNSCGSVLLATYVWAGLPYGEHGLCNSGLLNNYYLNDSGGSGGPSGCATGVPSNGSCAGYPKPVWQKGVVGVPSDGVRDLPDVSLFSANGIWGHFYIFCWSNPAYFNGGGSAPCTGAPSGWASAGGTSFAAPIMAGIQALVNTQTGGRQGNPNYRLYQLAAGEYGLSGSAACNSNNGNTVGSSYIFYDVTLGDIDAPCLSGSVDCFAPPTPPPPNPWYGVLSTSNQSYLPAYPAQTGWDFATGIGTVNVANLVKNWNVKTNTHDFNGDGMSDIAWRDGNGDVALWLMNGTSAALTGGIGGVPLTWSIAGQRDFNGDGRYDLLWRDTSGNTAIWFLNGTQVTSALNVGNIATSWKVVGTGDFNGDNFGDLLWEDNNGNLAVWLMNTVTVISSSGLGNLLPTVWSVAGIGDFNGDGRSDILWRDTSGNTAIWFMNGTTVASSTSVGNVPTWLVVGTGDFDGDGKSDILWRDNGGDAAIWLMNGAAVSSAGALGDVPNTWSIALVGDYNGDGKSDIVWRNDVGDTSIWFMNGTSVASTGAVGNIPTNWTAQSVNAE